MPTRRQPGRHAAPRGQLTASKRDLAWWRAHPGAREKAREEFESLPEDVQGDLLQVMDRHMRDVARSGDVKKLDSDILEWRTRKGSNHYRVLFFQWGHVSVALTAFYKNQQKTPPEDLKRAHTRCKAWRASLGPKPPTGWTPG